MINWGFKRREAEKSQFFKKLVILWQMEKSRSCLQRFFPITPKWLEVCGILTPSCLKSNHSKRLSQERSLIIQWQNHSLPLLIYILLFGSIIGSNAVKQCCQLWYVIEIWSILMILYWRRDIELVSLEKMLLPRDMTK